MAIDIGLGGGFTKPIPTQLGKPVLLPQPAPLSVGIDATLLGDREYVEPVSSGLPAQTIPTLVLAQTAPVQYSSPDRVIQAYRNRASTGITQSQAVDVLMNQFGYSHTDAQDAVTVEMPTPVFTGTADDPEISVSGSTMEGTPSGVVELTHYGPSILHALDLSRVLGIITIVGLGVLVMTER